MPRPVLELRDIERFREDFRDGSSLNVNIRVKRCVGINKRSEYPGEAPEMLFNDIYVEAEVRVIPLGEVKESNGLLMVGDLMMTVPYELRGPQHKDYQISGNKLDPETVADHVFIDAPYQGEWVVVGVPQPLHFNGLEPLFWQVNVRRLRDGAKGRQ